MAHVKDRMDWRRLEEQAGRLEVRKEFLIYVYSFVVKLVCLVDAETRVEELST